MKNKKLLIPALLLAFGTLAGCNINGGDTDPVIPPVSSSTEGPASSTSEVIPTSEVTSEDSTEVSTEISSETSSEEPNPITEIELDRAKVKLGVGDTWTSVYDVVPADTEDTVSWESSDPAVASVDEEGVITAVAVGTATITAKNFDGTVTDECAVTVVAKKNSFTQAEASYLINGTTGGYIYSQFYSQGVGFQLPFAAGMAMDETVEDMFVFRGNSMTKQEFNDYVKVFENLKGVVYSNSQPAIGYPWAVDDEISEDFEDVCVDSLNAKCTVQLRYSDGAHIMNDVAVVALDKNGQLVVYLTMYYAYFGSLSGGLYVIDPDKLGDTNYYSDIATSFELFNEFFYETKNFVTPGMPVMTGGSYDGKVCFAISEYMYDYPWTFGNAFSENFEVIYSTYAQNVTETYYTDYIAALLEKGYTLAGTVKNVAWYTLTTATGYYQVGVTYSDYTEQGYGIVGNIIFRFTPVHVSATVPVGVINRYLQEMCFNSSFKNVTNEFAGVTVDEDGVYFDIVKLDMDKDGVKETEALYLELKGDATAAIATALTNAGFTYYEDYGSYLDATFRTQIIVGYDATDNVTYIYVISYYYGFDDMKTTILALLTQGYGYPTEDATAIYNSIAAQLDVITYGVTQKGALVFKYAGKATDYALALKAAGFNVYNGAKYGATYLVLNADQSIVIYIVDNGDGSITVQISFTAYVDPNASSEETSTVEESSESVAESTSEPESSEESTSEPEVQE